MVEPRIRVRANRATGELEVEGPEDVVNKWWDRMWPEISQSHLDQPGQANLDSLNDLSDTPTHFGEYFATIRSDITDVDKALVTSVFIQEHDSESMFTTKELNQLLLSQNIKLANPSECVRRLVATKRAFVVTRGKFRISASGIEHAKSLSRRGGAS